MPRPSPLAVAPPLTPEARELASHPRHVAFARQLARRYAEKSGVDPDQCESSALLGLCQAAAAFDPAKGVRFSTFAARRISGAIVDDVRSTNFGKRHHFFRLASLHDRVDEDGHSIADTLVADDGPVGDDIAFVDYIEQLIRHVPAAQRTVMRLLYAGAEGLTMRAAGRRMGVSEYRISQLHGRAVALIRGRVATHGDPGERVNRVSRTRPTLDGPP